MAEAGEENDMSEGEQLNVDALGDDGFKWAEAFMDTLAKHPEIEVDLDLMVGWFANAIEVASMKRTRERDEARSALTPADQAALDRIAKSKPDMEDAIAEAREWAEQRVTELGRERDEAEAREAALREGAEFALSVLDAEIKEQVPVPYENGAKLRYTAAKKLRQALQTASPQPQPGACEVCGATDEWVSMKNEVIESGEMCGRCLREGRPRTGIRPSPQPEGET